MQREGGGEHHARDGAGSRLGPDARRHACAPGELAQTKEYLRTHGEDAATNFHSIASKGSVETLKVVVGSMDKDAINTLSGISGTLLHATICSGEDVEDKVNVLLDHNAHPSTIGGRHGTTLNAAASFHLQSVAKLLLERLPESKSGR